MDSQRGLNSTFPSISPSTTVGVTQMSLAEMDSLLSPFVRKRADEFSLEEIEILIEEVGLLRHILLSRDPNCNASKRLGWEIVANNLASKLPNNPSRTGTQLRKKWENLVHKARRKLKDGVLAQEMERNECIRLVVQYLIEANTNRLQTGDRSNVLNNSLNSTMLTFENLPELPSNVEINGESGGVPAESNRVVSIKVDEPETAQGTVSTGPSNTETNSPSESYDDGSSNRDTAADIQFLTSSNDPLEPNTNVQSRRIKRRRIDSEELLRRSVAEHELRIKVLDMKHRYWHLKYESLKKKLQTDVQQNSTV